MLPLAGKWVGIGGRPTSLPKRDDDGIAAPFSVDTAAAGSRSISSSSSFRLEKLAQVVESCCGSFAFMAASNMTGLRDLGVMIDSCIDLGILWVLFVMGDIELRPPMSVDGPGVLVKQFAVQPIACTGGCVSGNSLELSSLDPLFAVHPVDTIGTDDRSVGRKL
uniref:Uncharacterized protein n=1 Tax=Anopheles funestus TaxID=62324 RepID=A0A182S1C2_ANOFN